MQEDRDNRGVHLGFPNAALDSADVPLDLNKLVVKNRASTFYMRVESDSYEELNIYTGDILVIDRALKMKPGNIFVGSLEGEFVVQKYSNDPETEVDLFGVVTHIIHKLRE